MSNSNDSCRYLGFFTCGFLYCCSDILLAVDGFCFLSCRLRWCGDVVGVGVEVAACKSVGTVEVLEGCKAAGMKVVGIAVAVVAGSEIVEVAGNVAVVGAVAGIVAWRLLVVASSCIDSC